ncbi:MAG: tripartite tricarboxylate transporter substrate binding protein [Burkholderiales bacterium]|nr:tripartite tricarboxylate transporter substrate binding protein [Burkholderiales bacterium]
MIPPRARTGTALRLFAQLAAASALASASGFATAQIFPERPVRLVLSFGAPGGMPDTVGRLIAPKLSETWGKQMVVDPRAGAGGVVGTEIAAKAAPDGHTLVIVSPAHAINPSLRRKLPYDSVKDFTPITQLVENPNILTITPKVSARSVKELIALAKAKPGALAYGSAGVGSSQHLSGELFKSMTGVDMVHIPFKGGAAVVIDLLAARVQLTFGATTSLPHIRAGRLIALAVTTAKRSPQMPDVPTIAEAGVPNYEAAVWYGLLAPAHVPASIAGKLHRDITTVLNLPDVREVLANVMADVRPSASPGAFAEFLATETTKWTAVVKASGARED